MLFRSPPFRTPLREGTAELAKSSATGVVWEESLISGCSGDDGWWRKVSCSCRWWVEAPESLLDRLESSWNGCRPQVDHVTIGNEFGHELKLVDIEVTKTFTQRQGGLTTFVSKLSWLADGIKLVIWS